MKRHFATAAGPGDPQSIGQNRDRANSAERRRKAGGPTGKGGPTPSRKLAASIGDRILEPLPTVPPPARVFQNVGAPPLQQTLELRVLLDLAKSNREAPDTRAKLEKALKRQFTDLGMELALRASPRTPKNLLVMSFPTLGKVLNDQTGRGNVDADYAPARNRAIVQIVEDFELRHPHLHFAFVSEDGWKELSVVVSGGTPADVEEAREALSRELEPRVHEVTDQYLGRRIAALDERIEYGLGRAQEAEIGDVDLSALIAERAKIRDLREQFAQSTDSIVHLNMRSVPEGAGAVKLREVWALAMSEAGLTRVGGGRREGGMTQEKFTGALESFVEVMDTLANETVLVGDQMLPVLSPNEEIGYPSYDANVYKAWRRGDLRKEHFYTPQGYEAFRRSLELTNMLDFVYPGTGNDLATKVPENVGRANKVVELLRSGAPLDRWPRDMEPQEGRRKREATPLKELEALLSWGPSGRADPRKGLPSEMTFFERAQRTNPDKSPRNRAYLEFDLIGLGVHLQNARVKELHQLARSVMPEGPGSTVRRPVTDKEVFDAMVRVNDHAQRYRASLKRRVHRVVNRSYAAAVKKLRASGKPEDQKLADELQSERGQRNSLSGGDERWMDVHMAFASRPDLRAVLLRQLYIAKKQLDVRVSISRAYVGEPEDRPGTPQIRRVHEVALKALDTGSKRLKQIETALNMLKQRAERLKLALRSEPKKSPRAAKLKSLLSGVARFERKRYVADSTRGMYLAYSERRDREIAYSYDDLVGRRLAPLELLADDLEKAA